MKYTSLPFLLHISTGYSIEHIGQRQTNNSTLGGGDNFSFSIAGIEFTEIIIYTSIKGRKLVRLRTFDAILFVPVEDKHL